MGEASVELEKLNIDGSLFNLEPRDWLGVATLSMMIQIFESVDSLEKLVLLPVS